MEAQFSQCPALSPSLKHIILRSTSLWKHNAVNAQHSAQDESPPGSSYPFMSHSAHTRGSRFIQKNNSPHGLATRLYRTAHTPSEADPFGRTIHLRAWIPVYATQRTHTRKQINSRDQFAPWPVYPFMPHSAHTLGSTSIRDIYSTHDLIIRI